MTDDDLQADRSSGILGALLTPLRLPGRILGELGTISRAVVSLQRTADVHLTSLDARAGRLNDGLGRLQDSMNRVEVKIGALTSLEATIEERMDGLRTDLNTRLLAVEAEVRGIRPPIEQVARDVQSIGQLLPDPSDGPLARLKDSLTPS
jgi:hypothetical protein